MSKRRKNGPDPHRTCPYEVEEEADGEEPLEWGSTDFVDDILYGLEAADMDEFADEAEYIRQIEEENDLGL